jgi:hypothetical protein
MKSNKGALRSSTRMSSDIIVDVVKKACTIELHTANLLGLPPSVEIQMYTRSGYARLLAPQGIVIRSSGRIEIYGFKEIGWPSSNVKVVTSSAGQRVWPPA